MVEQTTRYGLGITVALAYDVAVDRTRAALQHEGFGVLTDIDIRATLKKKLEVDFRPYVILGACNPPLAHQALRAERDIGLLLPCNVIVYAGDTAGTSVIAALDPVAVMELTEREDIRAVALEVRQRLERALAAIERDATA
ncbi:MAG: DUF302 domain-containing protein [Gemmatimonadetes bacterium]|nr:DUF302 domain-containing protein [Gemmatimonadota bacterium]MCC6773920.1 DUF302 domain-containing protein [Gemmatimonadaceae bacterium]